MDIENISSAIDFVSGYRASLGAEQNALERTIDYSDLTAENLSNAEASFTELDVPAATVELSLVSVQLQTNVYVAKLANDAQNSILKLIGSSIDLKV